LEKHFYAKSYMAIDPTAFLKSTFICFVALEVTKFMVLRKHQSGHRDVRARLNVNGDRKIKSKTKVFEMDKIECNETTK
jgi:hypothetical protein